MKNLRFFVLALGLTVALSSCKIFGNLFKPKYGCPTNGKNIGAEKLATDDPKAMKQAKKAKKFRA